MNKVSPNGVRINEIEPKMLMYVCVCVCAYDRTDSLFFFYSYIFFFIQRRVSILVQLYRSSSWTVFLFHGLFGCSKIKIYMCASLFFFSLVVGVLVLVFGLQSMLRFDPEKNDLYIAWTKIKMCVNKQPMAHLQIDNRKKKKYIMTQRQIVQNESFIVTGERPK